MKQAKTTKQINKAYHSHMKSIIKGAHEKEIFDSLSQGKNSYLRLDRLASSSFDKSWIEIIEDCIFDLGQIIANPRLNTKVEGSLTPVELARKTNSETVQHLASHTQYIKEIDEYGNVIPSKLLSMYADDDIHTYENRFIATFVRRLMLFITKRYEYVTKFAKLRNEEILYFKNKSIVDGAEVEIETKVKVSYKNDDEEAQINSKYVDRIAQTRDYIMYFYNSPFMKAMKNEKDVRNPIMQTNIIRKNLKYHHCYEVYRFIETYDRLGVNYKVDENYSLFNNDEINELNRTLIANYITLRGKDTSKFKKTNTNVYKPRILTTAEDEAFIYGPLLEGPIEFARVDEGYQAYLDSKLKKDLPQYPTKKEREYYEDEYSAKAENKQDLKQKNDLLKRRQKEVNAFEKSVKNILVKREEAKQALIAQEMAAVKQEENDLLARARQEIVNASKADMANTINEKVAKNKAAKRKELSAKPVSFNDAANEVWPQLANEPAQAKEVKEEQPKVEEAPIKEQAPVEEVKPEPVKEEPKKEKKAPVKKVDKKASPKKEKKTETKAKEAPKAEPKKEEKPLKNKKAAKKAEKKKEKPAPAAPQKHVKAKHSRKGFRK